MKKKNQTPIYANVTLVKSTIILENVFEHVGIGEYLFMVTVHKTWEV